MKMTKFRNNSKSSASIDKYLRKSSSTKNHNDISKIYNIKDNKDKKIKKQKKQNDKIYNNLLYKDQNMNLL